MHEPGEISKAGSRGERPQAPGLDQRRRFGDPRRLAALVNEAGRVYVQVDRRVSSDRNCCCL